MKTSIMLIIISCFNLTCFAVCPPADLTGDCRVDIADFAKLAGDWLLDMDHESLLLLASQWLTQGIPLDDMVWVPINDPGVDEDGDGVPDHEPFDGYMSKFETTNAQYREFLNAAIVSGDIIIGPDDVVYGADGSNNGMDFVGQPYFDIYPKVYYSQITYIDGVFSVRSRDGYDMSNHPAVALSWYGATAFANYYGWRLPTEWEWQAVADYDGSYPYGCGTTIDQSKANYFDGDYANPLGLISPPFTSPVGYYPAYGYGMSDMAGNAFEFTSSCYFEDCSGYNYRVTRGSSYAPDSAGCSVVARFGQDAYLRNASCGFRVVRDFD